GQSPRPRDGTRLAAPVNSPIHPDADDRDGVFTRDGPRPGTAMAPTAVTSTDRLTALLADWQPHGIDQASGLPAWAYDDPKVFAHERRAFFARTWLVVAHEQDLPQPH